MQPDISVIVVNFRTPDLTVRALAAAAAASGDRTIEEIVVENGSADDSALRIGVARPQARVIEESDNRGFAAGVNAGIRASSGRLLLLLNSDAFMQADALARLADYLDAHPRAGVVAPALHNDDGSLQNNAYRRFPNMLTVLFDLSYPLGMLTHRRALHPHNLPSRRFDRARPVAHVMGAVMLVRVEAALAAGTLDEGYFLYLEETEWQRRIARAGWEIHIEPAAIATHLGGASSPGDHSSISPHYITSVRRYFGDSRVTRGVIFVAAWTSVVSLRLLARFGYRPRSSRALARSYRDVIARLAA